MPSPQHHTYDKRYGLKTNVILVLLAVWRQHNYSLCT